MVSGYPRERFRSPALTIVAASPTITQRRRGAASRRRGKGVKPHSHNHPAGIKLLPPAAGYQGGGFDRVRREEEGAPTTGLGGQYAKFKPTPTATNRPINQSVGLGRPTG
jgi:hypothetical protein